MEEKQPGYQTIRGLLDALETFLHDHLKEYQLKVKQEGWSDQPARRPIRIYKQTTPIPNDDEPMIPLIQMQVITGEDSWSQSKKIETSQVNVRLTIFIWDPDVVEGKLTLLDMIEKIRFDLKREKVIDGYSMDTELEFLIYPDNTDGDHIAELSTTWNIPVVVPKKREIIW
jgi:hypothetical protein